MEQVGVEAVLARAGHAGARADAGRERVAQAGGDLAAAVGVGAGQDGGELVAPEAPERVTGAQRVGHHARRPAQQLVPRGVTELVVDRLEAVEVQVHEGDAPAGGGAPQLRAQALGEPEAVQARGQRVGAGDAGELLAVLLLDAGLPDAHRAGRGEGEHQADQVHGSVGPPWAGTWLSPSTASSESAETRATVPRG